MNYSNYYLIQYLTKWPIIFCFCLLSYFTCSILFHTYDKQDGELCSFSPCGFHGLLEAVNWSLTSSSGPGRVASSASPVLLLLVLLLGHGGFDFTLKQTEAGAEWPAGSRRSSGAAAAAEESLLCSGRCCGTSSPWCSSLAPPLWRWWSRSLASCWFCSPWAARWTPPGSRAFSQEQSRTSRSQNLWRQRDQHLPEGTEVFPDFLLRSVWRQAAHKDLLHRFLALHGLGLLGVDHLPVELVFLLWSHLQTQNQSRSSVSWWVKELDQPSGPAAPRTFSTLSGSLKSTKPKPLERPVSGSSFSVQSTTSPYLEK